MVVVAAGVDAQVLALRVVLPVVVEVAAGVDGAEFEDGFRAGEAPPRAGDVHAVLDQIAAGAFHDAGRDGPARGQRLPVGEIGALACR